MVELWTCRDTLALAIHPLAGTVAIHPMLTVSQVSKSFAGRILFEDVSLRVNRGDRIGLVGPNGAGKSTLFSLILGEASPDSAGRCQFWRRRHLNVNIEERAARPTDRLLSATQPCDAGLSIIYLEGACDARVLGGHYANDNCWS